MQLRKEKQNNARTFEKLLSQFRRSIEDQELYRRFSKGKLKIGEKLLIIGIAFGIVCVSIFSQNNTVKISCLVALALILVISILTFFNERPKLNVKNFEKIEMDDLSNKRLNLVSVRY